MIVVYCANRRIYKQLPTAINSLILNNDVEKIYLLIEDNSIDYIDIPQVEFINCSNFDFLIRNNINCTKRFPYMAMVRCFLTKILNEDKVLYLDIDTTVDGDLLDLWNINLGSNFIAAREESNGYFNSGVLLMNLKLLRESVYDDRLIDLLKKCKMVFPDQDAMNFIFKNKIISIDAKYNKMGSASQAYDGNDICIRHYAGIAKPWSEKAAEKDRTFWSKYYTPSLIFTKSD